MNIPTSTTNTTRKNTSRKNTWRKSTAVVSPRIKWKPVTIPDDDFTLIIDTREQQPLFQRPQKGLNIIHKKLDDGDYSVLGFEDKIFIERKKLSDLLSYIGRERKATVGKLSRVRDFAFKGLIIEVDESTLYNQQMYPQMSKMTKEMVEAFLLSFEIRFGGHYKCSRYRTECERWVLNHAVYTYKRLRLV